MSMSPLGTNWRVYRLWSILATLPFCNAVASPSGEAISLTGDIDQTMVSHFDALVNSNTRKVRISSP